MISDAKVAALCKAVLTNGYYSEQSLESSVDRAIAYASEAYPAYLEAAAVLDQVMPQAVALSEAILKIEEAAVTALKEFAKEEDIPTNPTLKVLLLAASYKRAMNANANFERIVARIAEAVMPVGSYAEVKACPDVVLPYLQSIIDSKQRPFNEAA